MNNPVVFLLGSIIGFVARDLIMNKYNEIKRKEQKESWDLVLDKLMRIEKEAENRRPSPPPFAPYPLPPPSSICSSLSSISSMETEYDEDFVSVST